MTLTQYPPPRRRRYKTKKDFKPTECYEAHRALGDAAGENMDCSVRALAVVTGIPYEQARALLAAEGRKTRRRTPTHILENALTDLGYAGIQVDPFTIIAKYPGKHKFKTCITSHQMDRFPEAWRDGKTYLFYSRGHVLAIIDGVNHDWSRGRSLRAYRLVEVVKK